VDIVVKSSLQLHNLLQIDCTEREREREKSINYSQHKKRSDAGPYLYLTIGIKTLALLISLPHTRPKPLRGLLIFAMPCKGHKLVMKNVRMLITFEPMRF